MDDISAGAGGEALPVLHQATTWADLAGTVAPVSYAWPGWLAHGLLTLLAAESGIGKSALALQICKRGTSVAPWRDVCSGCTERRPR